MTAGWTSEERDAIGTLAEHGFIVESRDADRDNLQRFFHEVRESREQLRMTVLTTLQCNFACDYCIQGDHGDYNKHAAKMSLETAARVGDWAEQRLEALRPESYVLTFFGGEPLLNLPVMYYLAERMWKVCDARGVRMLINIITNGLLLTPEIVDRLNAFGLNGIKITLDGDRDTHNRMRPLRGGQGTFDRIVHNVRQVAHKTRIAIGGNFDMETADSYPALLDFLKEQDFADKLSKVAFKPIIRERKEQPAPAVASPVKGSKFIALTAVERQAAGRRVHDLGRRGRELDERLRQLPHASTTRWRSCARKPRSAASRPSTASTWARAKSIAATRTPSARTVRSTPARALPAMPRSRSATSTAGRSRRGRTRPRDSRRCRRGRSAATAPSFPSAPAAARSPRTTSSAASTSPTATRRPSRPASCRSRGRLPPSAPQPSTSYVTTTRHRTVQEDSMKNEKKQDKKTTLRPWLVDVVVENLR